MAAGQRNRWCNNGRPVLVGTTSVEKSELLSSLLAGQEIPHNLLNAKPENVERESEIVAQAGRAGAVTIATNMAGQGTDIILGGNSDYRPARMREVLQPSGETGGRPQDAAALATQFRRRWVRRPAASAQPRSGEPLSCPLTDDTDQALGQLARIWSRHGATRPSVLSSWRSAYRC